MPSCAHKQRHAHDGKKADKAHIEVVPDKYKEVNGVSLHFEGWEERHGSSRVKCRLVNQSDATVYFTGYGIPSPWYRIQKAENGAWIEHNVGWFCGTGLRTPALPSGKSSVFWVFFPENTEVIRVGLTFSSNQFDPEEKDVDIVWTDEITAPP